MGKRADSLALHSANGNKKPPRGIKEALAVNLSFCAGNGYPLQHLSRASALAQTCLCGKQEWIAHHSTDQSWESASEASEDLSIVVESSFMVPGGGLECLRENSAFVQRIVRNSNGKHNRLRKFLVLTQSLEPHDLLKSADFSLFLGKLQDVAPLCLNKRMTFTTSRYLSDGRQLEVPVNDKQNSRCNDN